MDCCHLTRRSVLRYATIAAGTSLLPVLDPERSYAATYAARRGASSPAHVAINLELVTLTEKSFVVTWYTALPIPADTTGRLTPAPGGTTLMVGTSPLNLKTVIDRDDATPYHYAEVSGLEPGQTYYYLALSDGVPATPSLSQYGSAVGKAVVGAVGTVYSFTTPPAPKGEHLFTLALCNDLHLGETVAGLATSVGGVGLPPGISTPAGEPPYAETMSKALVEDVRKRAANHLLAAGDVSSEAATKDLRESKAILDTWGHYGRDYFVARGNHDRCHTDADCTKNSCLPSKFGDGKYDHFREVWFPGAYNGPTWDAHDFHGLHIVRTDTYDKTGNGGDAGGFSPSQFNWFQKEIKAHRDQPTLVFGHHYLGAFDKTQGAAISALYAKSPGVFFQQAGHSHANALVANAAAPHVTFQQTGSVKEYPGGFALLRVHTGGYAYNFYKTRADLAREWSERTREEYQGLAPFQQMGSLASRNHVRDVDFSGLRKAPVARPPVTTQTPVREQLPHTGGDTRLAALGAAAVTGAAALIRSANR